MSDQFALHIVVYKIASIRHAAPPPPLLTASLLTFANSPEGQNNSLEADKVRNLPLFLFRIASFVSAVEDSPGIVACSDNLDGPAAIDLNEAKAKLLVLFGDDSAVGSQCP